MKKSTNLITAGRCPTLHAGAVNPPVVRASTIIFPNHAAYQAADEGKYVDVYSVAAQATTPDPWYAIAGTSTTFALQDALKKLEHADDCLITSSGLEAITLTLQAFLGNGDHLLMPDTVYGPARRFCNTMLKRFGITTTYYNPATTIDALEALIQPNTKLIYMESPGSLTFEMQDVTSIVTLAKKYNLLTALDNVWSSGVFYNPLDHGVDICIQVLTKYISGHSDVILGAVLTCGDTIQPLKKAYQQLGINTSPDDCWLALRGMRSLMARLERHQRSAMQVATWLQTQSIVQSIRYPALPTDVFHARWKQDFTGAASLFTIVLDKRYSEVALSAMLDNLTLFAMGYSWGGFESLIITFDPTSIRTATHWQEINTCLRLYVGLEDPEDLIQDLSEGFNRLCSAQ